MEIPNSQNKKVPTISVSMIVKNEEEMLARALASVKGVDEIVIADTGSTDNTIEIAKKYTDNIYTEYKWNDNFSEARNFSLSKCTKDWILIIDADEILESTIDKVRNIIKKAEQEKKLFIWIQLRGTTTNSHSKSVRVFKNVPGMNWVGSAHNVIKYASVSPTDSNSYYSDLKLEFGYSPAHKKDPKRTLRILLKAVRENPGLARETFYLAREYFEIFKMYESAIFWIDRYIKITRFRAELAEAYLIKAKCLWKLNQGNDARITCMNAIRVNPDWKEALLFMAQINYEPDKSKWLEFANLARNNNVLFIRTPEEKGEEYYNKIFEVNRDMSRYKHIYKKISELVKNNSVLDIGCGLAELSRYIEDYEGFDFSKKAVEIANDKRIRLGNIYSKEDYTKKDIYICTEVLEHVDDLKLIKNLPKGSRFIFSVPSFTDPSHLRTYTKETVKNLPIKIKKIYRFNWDGKKWSSKEKDTSNYILLVDSLVL